MTVTLIFVAICGLGSAAIGLWPYAREDAPVPWGMVVAGLALAGIAFVQLAGGALIWIILLAAIATVGNAYQAIRIRRDRRT